MKTCNTLFNHSQNEWPPDKISLLHLWSCIPNTNLLMQTSLAAFFSEWLHFHHCHHLHQMFIAQKLSQGWRTKTWQWCKGSCEMIAWDEINSRVLLLGDQLYNWKLLSQATVASSSIRKAQCMRTWFSFLQVFFSFTVPPNEVCSFHRSLQASSEPNYFVVWMRLEDINQHIHWENMERLWHF